MSGVRLLLSRLLSNYGGPGGPSSPGNGPAAATTAVAAAAAATTTATASATAATVAAAAHSGAPGVLPAAAAVTTTATTPQPSTDAATGSAAVMSVLGAATVAGGALATGPTVANVAQRADGAKALVEVAAAAGAATVALPTKEMPPFPELLRMAEETLAAYALSRGGANGDGLAAAATATDVSGSTAATTAATVVALAATATASTAVPSSVADTGAEIATTTSALLNSSGDRPVTDAVGSVMAQSSWSLSSIIPTPTFMGGMLAGSVVVGLAGLVIVANADTIVRWLPSGWAWPTWARPHERTVALTGAINALDDVDDSVPLSEDASMRQEQLELHATCCVCFDRLTNRVLSCGHRLCSACVAEILHKHKPLCPVCNCSLTTVQRLF